MPSDKQVQIAKINRQLEDLREQRGREPWGTERHKEIRRMISELLEERDELGRPDAP